MAELRTIDTEGGDGGRGAPASAADRVERGDEAHFEALLERALRVDVPPPGAVRRPPRRMWTWTRMALAAAVVLAIGVTVNTLQDAAFFGGPDLAKDVMAHVRHEPRALVRTQEIVSGDAMQQVLQAAGASLSPLESPVTYVKLCPFRGQMVAHLAVQAENGPVTVMLLPDETVDAPMPIDEDGFVGTIVPLGDMGGSFAVVGEFAGDIETIKDQVADAVRWRL